MSPWARFATFSLRQSITFTFARFVAMQVVTGPIKRHQNGFALFVAMLPAPCYDRSRWNWRAKSQLLSSSRSSCCLMALLSPAW